MFSRLNNNLSIWNQLDGRLGFIHVRQFGLQIFRVGMNHCEDSKLITGI
ncbi:hypothetical protein [Clostridium sporogenes]|nr:hypothetical protein [Clostridium sporogenes]MCW6110085.1 hypothetical protein [Clostridium sporogenes]